MPCGALLYLQHQSFDCVHKYTEQSLWKLGTFSATFFPIQHHLLLHTPTITLSSTTSLIWYGDDIYDEDCSELSGTRLATVATLCPQLRELGMKNLRLSGPSEAIFNHLTSLDCSACIVDETTNMPPLLQLAPRLRALKAHGCSAGFASMVGHHHALRMLHADGRGWVELVHQLPALEDLKMLVRFTPDDPWLQHADMFREEMTSRVMGWRGLRSLTLSIQLGYYPFHMRRLLSLLADALGGTVVKLRCACGLLGPVSEASEVLRCLPSFSRLEQLHIGLHGVGISGVKIDGGLRRRNGPRHSPRSCVCAMLAPLPTLRLRTPRLKTLVLILRHAPRNPYWPRAFEPWEMDIAEGHCGALCAGNPGVHVQLRDAIPWEVE